MTLCDLGRVRSKALRHDAYSEAILLQNLQQNVKPAYHSAKVKPMKCVKTLLRIMTPKIFKKEKSYTFEGVVDRKSNDSSGSSSLYPRQKRCILGRSGGDVAHFLPRSGPSAMFYGTVMKCALGTDTPAPNATVQQAMIHGVLGKGGRKINHTGLKHNALNKCQFSRQKELYDQYPYFVLVPILDYAEVQDWTEKEDRDLSYDALVLVGRSEEGLDFRDEVLRSTPCSEGEAETALQLLEAFTKALSMELQASDFTDLPNIAPKKFKKEVRSELAQLETTKEKLEKDGTPILRLQKREVGELAKLSFQKNPSNTVPDPFLLAVKAAVNWSYRCDTKLLPGGGEASFCESSCSGFGEMQHPKSVVPPKMLVLCNTDPDMSDLED
ncbi:expressed unknown protein [Seminavis robusta]|uniref:Uncharacterized protein n=1 Tax=Seminavis robusta TaxID=568900 RepID=A0A9N8DMU9_9STRA|nr:expressed unknown protein [Seminavis robusta]|eukprot:Sro232_g093830.1 n/a (383) ;mRNA; r:29959-31107